MTFQLEDGFTLQEAMDILAGENDDDFNLNLDAIYITPPEPSALTDEDSGDDDEGGLLDNLSSRQLMAQAEIKLVDNRVISNSGDLNDIINEPRSTSNQSGYIEDPTDISDQISDDNPIEVASTSNQCAPHVSDDTSNNHDTMVKSLKRKKEALIEKRKKQIKLAKQLKKTPSKEIQRQLDALNEDNPWIEGDLESPFILPFPEPDYRKYRDFTAVEFFELYFDEGVFDMLEEETKKYALFLNCPDPKITKAEIRCFIAILILSGYNVLPGKRFYWDSGEDMRNHLVVKSGMRRNRFEQLLRFLHCTDNSEVDPLDKMYKIRPLVSKLQNNFMKYFMPSEHLSYDETIVKYFGKHGCKQFLKGKPIRFGYKIWSLNTTSGYLVNFDVYQGKSLGMPEDLDFVFGKPTAPLVKMITELPQEKKCLPYKFYFDNLFTNTYLMNYLSGLGYGGTGTLREDRIPKECGIVTKKKEMKKEQERGHFEHAVSRDDGIILAKWFDNGIVSMLSNCHGVQPVTSAKRWSHAERKSVQLPRPACFSEYNRYMGGTDRMDENIAKYRIAIRNKKWYWPLFSWLIDASVNNAWCLSKSSGRQETQLEFRRQLVEAYIKKYGELSKGGGRPSSTKSLSGNRISDLVRYDGVGHLVVHTPEKKKKRCAEEGCSSIMRTMCTKCEVGLCIECFLPFHTKTYKP